MLNYMDKEYFKTTNEIIELSLLDEKYFYNNKDNKKLYFEEKENLFFIFIEKEDGIYRYTTNNLNDKSKIKVSFSSKEHFLKTKLFEFKTVHEDQKNKENEHFCKSFKNIIKNTKELRLKALLNIV